MILGVGGPTSVKALLQGAFNIEKALVGCWSIRRVLYGLTKLTQKFFDTSNNREMAPDVNLALQVFMFILTPSHITHYYR